jgi:hypothetical protein
MRAASRFSRCQNDRRVEARIAAALHLRDLLTLDFAG